MPVLLLLMALGVFGYFLWRSRTTTLTRNCRWRLDRGADEWYCAYCGGRARGGVDKSPTCCVQTSNSGP
ncbi:hypothetical protein SAMN04488239_102425 [Ruegeria marina]|uniref:Uncharacterized protein n=1 Tax=Ruegeria marina TaxID=639004 RepID=A0A1G6M8T8_9RHOB|nr:hypothetical protein SAMN04488239_102425 [Ruegeria marina]